MQSELINSINNFLFFFFRIIAIRCGPQSGIEVSISKSPQELDFYPSTLVRDRKWQNLNGSFREVNWQKIEGKNFINKIEYLMASLLTFY